MTVSTTTLTRAAGVAAALAGTIFIGVQIGHPSMELASVTTTGWAVRNIAKVVMAALAIGGFTGMYARQVRRAGVLGLVGYVLLCTGYLAMLSVAFVAATVLPSLASTAPAYVSDVLTAAAGGTPVGDIGLLQAALAVSGVGYMAGGLCFGIALFRAQVLARWASALLAVATISTLALSVLPHSFERPFAVPTGIALIGLGVSLWRHEHAPSTTSAQAVASNRQFQPAR